MARLIIGVDEAGRGPLAGPVAVGIVVASAKLNIKKIFPGVADSKKLSERKREEIFELLKKKSSQVDSLRYLVVFASAQMIDAKGITFAVRHAVYKGVRLLAPDPKGYKVLLDGLLKAPPEYKQQTIIHGDMLEPIISLASIAAKVTRDRLMKKLAKRYPKYGFEVHKGYGTRRHREAMLLLGLCNIHRRSYRIKPLD